MKYCLVLLFLSSNAYALNCAYMSTQELKEQCYEQNAYHERRMAETDQQIANTLNNSFIQAQTHEQEFQENRNYQAIQKQNEDLDAIIKLLNK